MATIIKVQEVRASHDEQLKKIELYRRAVNFIAGASIYLQDNCLLDQPLQHKDIKARLLGHWGTCPGINLVYAHMNRIINQHDVDAFLVTGPGHGAPANLANLYVEGALNHFYPELYAHTKQGISELVKGFSWPGYFPSHVNAQVPGSIHEGGELGYALAVAYGAAMDNKDLIVACIVGDGEAESGPTAAAWHSIKFINPAESGAVLPILHCNGYKISNPTIFGSMSDEELYHLFRGYGYQVCIVGDMHDPTYDFDAHMYGAMDWAYAEIRKIQTAAREGNPIHKPQWPMIVLRSPKGWTGPKFEQGLPVEGSFRSHQVPLKDCKSNKTSLTVIEEWLRSYNISDFFDANGVIRPEIVEMTPKGTRRMGVNPHTRGGEKFTPLNTPSIFEYEVKVDPENRGNVVGKNLYQAGLYLRDLIAKNPDNFRIFCPDELESNQLHAVFETTTRNYQWPIAKTDFNISKSGKVTEILSEHTCQGWLQGYVLTGRHGLFPSYEAFLGIVATMMDQYAKFMKMCEDVAWRHDVPSINYIETSTLWRQEHNGHSHQNPGFINTLLNKKSELLRVYLPPDANCVVSTLDHCLKSKNYVNLIVAGKQPFPQWLSMEEAVAHCRAGASVWKWASTDEGVSPDIVLVGIGCETTIEVVAAANILHKEFPELRVRVVNVTDLMILDKDANHPHGLCDKQFNSLFTANCPVIFNFHGYTSVLKQLLFGRTNSERFSFHGYIEEGTTTTPFDMLVVNKCSRYHLVTESILSASVTNDAVAARASERISYFEYMLREHKDYILAHNDDPTEIINFKYTSQTARQSRQCRPKQVL